MSEKHGGRNHSILSALLLPILVPVALVAVPLSIPIGKLKQRRLRQREEAFRDHMKASDRTMEWEDFVQAIEDDLGTPIEERYSIQGPVRWWWSPENVREHSPHPFSDWTTMLDDARFTPFSKWCHERYLHSETGRALLVCPPQEMERKLLAVQAQALKAKSNRWIETVPPEILTQKQAAPKKTATP